MPASKDGKYSRVKPNEHTNHDGKGNFIQKAIKHPGAETKAAAKVGMSTHAYMEDKKDAPGKAGERARLGLTLEKMAQHKLHGTPQQHSADKLNLPKQKTVSYHSEPDGDETKSFPTPKDPMKATQGVTVAKDYKADSPVNVPRSANLEKRPVVKEGQPALPAGETEGSGSKTTKGDPSFSPQSSANKANPDKGIHIHISMGKEA